MEQKNQNEEMEQNNKNESFIRWQGRTIEELGKAVNILLSLCIATIGFIVSKLLEKDFIFFNCMAKLFVIIGSVSLLIATVILLILMYNRLHAFRGTAQIARKREKNKREGIDSLREKVRKKDECTWTLFNLSISTFSLGELFVIIGFIIEIAYK